eukprot:4791308-Alexandrium_andersonii.AAC.1
MEDAVVDANSSKEWSRHYVLSGRKEAQAARPGGDSAPAPSVAFAPRQGQGVEREAPELPYLAWVPWELSDPSSKKYLKRLLCQKW